MKIPKFKISRRERIYLIAGGAALLVGLVVYPAFKGAARFRQEQAESLQDEVALLEDLNALLANADAIEQEHALLRESLKGADELLFPAIENRIMAQSRMIKLLNELGPDLELEVSPGRSSLGDGSNQMNLALKGRGRYPEILKFLHRVETYRPLILVDSVQLAAAKQKNQRRPDGRDGRDGRSGQSKRTEQVKTTDPQIFFKISIQIYSREAEEGGA